MCDDDDALFEAGLYDAHCHVDPSEDPQRAMVRSRIARFTLMSTSLADMGAVAAAAGVDPERVLPAYGLHPWLSHCVQTDAALSKAEHYASVLEGGDGPPSAELVAALPDPTPLGDALGAVEERLRADGRALVGEVGLDSVFRVPRPESLRDGSERRLTAFRVRMDHQVRLLREQLRLASRYGRPLSVHCVKSHGRLFELYREHEVEHENETPHFCLHFFSGSEEHIRQWRAHPRLGGRLWVSFLHTERLGAERWRRLVRAVPDDRVLIETDSPRHGPQEDASLLRTLREVARAKEWPPDQIRETARRLRQNYDAFAKI